ncbi:hypothetical protein CAEBREN_18067 [Caenorhabditis brenneri]|uniref:Serpentine Receptor, class H n=1 Tax=Caenorhabditis brenneri TaxID=135651 RepID=G0NN53_CAEBE|nr:hypothetical protein CAEBREN_18067 [Caenorhabditis brenneri]
MSFICTPPTDYFASEAFLTLSTHIITAISMPVHVLGLYIILYKTPKAMSSVKYSFVNLHIWILIYDNSLGFLTIPYLLLPCMAGYTLGVLSYTGINEYYMVVLVMGSCANVLISIMAVFENRFDIICDFSWKRYWSKVRKGWLVTHYVLAILLFLPMKFMMPDPEAAKKKVFDALPCLTDKIRAVPVFILTEDWTYHIVALGSQLFIGLSEVGFFIDCTVFYIIRLLKSKRMSSATIKLQIKFLIALCIQMAVPGFLLVIPLIYSLFSITFDYYNQGFQNIVIALETTHGLLSTFTMIFIHHPYRVALFEMLPERV